TGVVTGSPSMIAEDTIPSCSVVNPVRAATWGLTVKTTAGPLVVLSIPFSTSTTGLVLLMVTPETASATFGAHVPNRAGSGENNLITTGCGAPVRSPIM